MTQAAIHANDTVDVELDTPEPFILVDTDDEVSPKKAEQQDDTGTPPPTGQDGDASGEPTPEERISRRDKRINQLIARAKDAEESLAATKAALELERAQRAEALASTSDPEATEIDSQIAEIDAQISAEQDDAAMRSVLKAQRMLLVREKSRLAQAAVERQQPQRQEYVPPQRTAEPHPSAKQWLSENAWYNAADDYGRTAYPTLKAEADSLYLALKARYGGDSQELFTELDAALADLPEFERVYAGRKKVTDEPPKAPDRPSRQNTAPNTRADDRGSPTAGNGNDPRLDKNDKAKLRAMGKDPDDPKVRAAYIKYNPSKFGRATA